MPFTQIDSLESSPTSSIVSQACSSLLTSQYYPSLMSQDSKYSIHEQLFSSLQVQQQLPPNVQGSHVANLEHLHHNRQLPNQLFPSLSAGLSNTTPTSTLSPQTSQISMTTIADRSHQHHPDQPSHHSFLDVIHDSSHTPSTSSMNSQHDLSAAHHLLHLQPIPSRIPSSLSTIPNALNLMNQSLVNSSSSSVFSPSEETKFFHPPIAQSSQQTHLLEQQHHLLQQQSILRGRSCSSSSSTSSSNTNNNSSGNCNIKDADNSLSIVEGRPHLTIIEQPTNRIRYRYKSEKGSHGGLTGENNTQAKKTYPTVRV